MAERGIQVIDLFEYPLDPGVAQLAGEAFARLHSVIPLEATPEDLVVAVSDVTAQETLRSLAHLTLRRVVPVLAPREAIHWALDQVFGKRLGEETPHPPLGELLLKLGYLDQERLYRGLERQNRTGELLGKCLLDLGYLTEEEVSEALALQLRLPHLRLRRIRIRPAWGLLLPGAFMAEHLVVPVRVEGGTLLVATPEPRNQTLLDQVEAFTGLRVRAVFACQTEVGEALTKLHYAGPKAPPLRVEAWGEATVRLGYLSSMQLAGAGALSERTGETLEEALVRLGYLKRGQILESKAKAMAVGFRRLPRSEEANGWEGLLPLAICRRYRVLPLERRDTTLVLGMANPRDREAIDLVEAITELRVEPALVAEEELEARLRRLASRPPKRDLELYRRSLEGCLLALGYVDRFQFRQAQDLAKEKRKDPVSALLELGHVAEADVREALGVLAGYPHVSLARYPATPKVQEMVSAELMLKHSVLPLYRGGSYLVLAMADPLSGRAITAIEEHTKLRVLPVVASARELLAILDGLFLAEVLGVDPDMRALAEHLVGRGYLDRSQLVLVLREVAGGKAELDQVLARLGLMSEERFARLVSEYLRLPLVDLSLVERVETLLDALGQPVERRRAVDPVVRGVARLLEEAQAKGLGALPIAEEGRELRVALAEPSSRAKLERLRELLGRGIRPVVARRSELEDAIERSLGRRTLGNYLLMENIISQKELFEALSLAERTGVRVGRALISLGYITEGQLYQYLAEQQNLPFFDLTGAHLDPEIARILPGDLSRELGCLPLSMDEEEVAVAMIDPLDSLALRTVEEATARRVRPVVITEKDFGSALEDIYKEDYLNRSTTELLYRMPENSAFVTLTRTQMAVLVAILLASTVGVALNFTLFFIVVNALATVFYVASSVYKFYLVYRALAHTLEVEATDEEVAALDERRLPIYTVLVPLYREAEVLPGLIEALTRLDYPATKLDVKILLEEDDKDTIATFDRIKPPAHFERIIVPYAKPKTKPKACNYGLIHAKGEYTVIYDAEDLPEPDQLKKVQIAFSKTDPQVVCIQCKLNYYNRHQNILTRWFTTEYSMWFDLFLPGLDAARAPIPLGGTSNHFKTAALKEVGAWDPFNVTEDADLGVRLFKAGYRTAVVDSTTFEEANSELYNWIRQRSRWIKGYVQTWLVHMRHPLELMRSIGFRPWLSFQFVVGGTFFGALVNPIYWTLTALWFLTEWGFIQSIFPDAIFYVGALGLYFGNFAFTYLNVAGCMRREYYDMVKYALLSPLYWAIMSIGAWKGFLQLIYRPHFWEKTVHGLYSGPPVTAPARRLRDFF